MNVFLRDRRLERVVHGLVDGQVLVEARDLERAMGFEARCGEEERASVRELAARFDQDAESGGVDEVDLGEIDDEPLRRFCAQLEQGSTDIGCVVQVELAGEAHDDRPAAALDPGHGVFVELRLVGHVLGSA